MSNIFVVCRFYVLFLALAGFLFGQLFNGNFEWGATVAGGSGFLVAVLASFRFQAIHNHRYIVAGLCVLSVSGVVLNAANYYENYNVPGSYYAWFLIGPFIGALVFMASFVFFKMPPNKSSKSDGDGAAAS
ncbi:MAG: hypothetical protein AAF564_26205 [Bacteroidota bacterium]